MARRVVCSHWYIELQDEFICRTTEDGYVIFEMPSRSIWAVGYILDDTSPQSTLAQRCVAQHDAEQRFPFRNDPVLRGQCSLSRRDDKHVLDTWTAARGELFESAFEFTNDADLEWALNAWRSIEYRPPEWVQYSISSEAPLFELRRALESDAGIEEALEDLQQQRQLHQAIPMLLLAAQANTATIRQSACYALGLIRGLSDADVVLLSNLNDESSLVRVRAAEALYRHGMSPERIVPVLIAILEEDDQMLLPNGEARIQGPCKYLCVSEERYFAAMALEEIGPIAREVARPVLLRRLHDASGCVRAMCARALVRQGESRAAVVPALVDALSDEQMSKRECVRVAETLFELGQPVELILPVLMEVVRNSEWGARAEAFYLLQRIGPSACSAVDAVTAAMADSDDSVREMAKETLRYISP